nr:MAG TPA: Sigma-54 interaction domain [Caudoviricetes sp.]
MKTTNPESSQAKRVWLRDDRGEIVYGTIASMNESLNLCSVRTDEGRLLRSVSTASIFEVKGSDVLTSLDGIVEIDEGIKDSILGAFRKAKDFVRDLANRLVKLASGKVFFKSTEDEQEIVQAVSREGIIIDTRDGSVPGGVNGFAMKDLVSGKTIGDQSVFEQKEMTQAEADAYARYYIAKAKGLEEGRDAEEVNIEAEKTLLDAHLNEGLITKEQHANGIKNIYESRKFFKELRERSKNREINEAESFIGPSAENLDILDVNGVDELFRYIIPYCEAYLKHGDNIGEVITNDKNTRLRAVPMIWGMPGIGKSAIMDDLTDGIQAWIRSDAGAKYFAPVTVDGQLRERTYDILTVNLAQTTKESLAVLTLQDETRVVYDDEDGGEAKTIQKTVALSTPVSKFPMYRFMDVSDEDKRLGDLYCNRGPNGTGCGGILFFDEISRAEKDVLQACMTFLQTRVMEGVYKLGSQWAMIGAGNRVVDGVDISWDTAMFDRFAHFNLIPSASDAMKYMSMIAEKASDTFKQSMAMLLDVGKKNDSFVIELVGNEMGYRDDVKKRHSVNKLTTDPGKSGKLKAANSRNMMETSLWMSIMMDSEIYNSMYKKDALDKDIIAKMQAGVLTNKEFDEALYKLTSIVHALRGKSAADTFEVFCRQARGFSKDDFDQGLANTALIERFQDGLDAVTKSLISKGLLPKNFKPIKFYKDGKIQEFGKGLDGEELEKEVYGVFDAFYDVPEDGSLRYMDDTKSIISLTPLGQYFMKPIVSMMGKGAKYKSFGSIAQIKVDLDSDDTKGFDAKAFGVNSSNVRNAAYVTLVVMLRQNGITFSIEDRVISGTDVTREMETKAARLVQAAATSKTKSTRLSPEAITGAKGEVKTAKLEGKKQIKEVSDVVTPLQWFNIMSFASTFEDKVPATEFIRIILSGINMVLVEHGVTPAYFLTRKASEEELSRIYNDGAKKREGESQFAYFDKRWVYNYLMCTGYARDNDDKNFLEMRDDIEGADDSTEMRMDYGIRDGYLPGAMIANAIYGSTRADAESFMEAVTEEDVLDNMAEAMGLLVVSNSMSAE